MKRYSGCTGYPFVDANMRELRCTGFMSNRGRQNVASFLVRDLGLDWRLGAQYFESVLLDYDVCSNYGMSNCFYPLRFQVMDHSIQIKC